MAKITISEAVGLTGVSESTIRRDIKSGKVSSEKDDRGRRRIDTAELARVYGQLTHATESNDTEMNAVDTPNNGAVNVNDSHDTPDDTPKVVSLLENQIADLRSQLEKTETQLQIATTEKTKLLDLLSAEKDEKRALMPPPAEDKPQKTPNWLLRLVGAR